MKILLIGEFSGVHNNLRKGLIEIGHDVDLVSTGDGWKKIGIKSNLLGKPGSKFSARLSRIIYPFINVSSLSKYDYVNVIGLQNKRPFIMKLLKNRNSSIGAFACGSDIYAVKHMLKREYSPIMGEAREDVYNLVNALNRTNDELNAKLMDCIIPMSRSYYEGVKHLSNSTKAILNFPVHLKDYENQSNKIHEKIKIVHPISRRGFKGSGFIIHALNELKKNYPAKVEIETFEKLAFHEYLEKIKESNIVVDQCYSYGYGMNALIAMSLGKIVMSGNYYDEITPIIGIKPDTSMIYKKLENLLTANIQELGEKSLDFVRFNHDSVNIAQKFINIINEEK